MKVLICGSRTWPDSSLIATRVGKLNPATDIVIHGGAPGADKMADAAARDLGIHVAEVKALWSKFDKGAGMMRNGVMLRMLEPEKVIAFDNGTAGTRHTIETAESMGIEVEVVEP